MPPIPQHQQGVTTMHKPTVHTLSQAMQHARNQGIRFNVTLHTQTAAQAAQLVRMLGLPEEGKRIALQPFGDEDRLAFRTYDGVGVQVYGPDEDLPPTPERGATSSSWDVVA